MAAGDTRLACRVNGTDGPGTTDCEDRNVAMCGIVGLFSKSLTVSERLGEHLGDMLTELSDRGPDSAGVALYRDTAPAGATKVSLHSAQPHHDWGVLHADLVEAFGATEPDVRASHAVLVIEADAETAQAWLREHYPQLRVMSAGQRLEIYKEAGLPRDFVARFALGDIAASHGLGHTRMATESAVTTDGSHPFWTGLDLCLVHNGSLSNHNWLRTRLRREGIEFQTENDTEVAAGYLTWRLAEGDTLEQALETCLTELDGFYTFAVGTAEGFAVLRDPIACKPAVMAETDDWVAMASEYRAIAVLPGAEDAVVWEPAPATVYSWERQPV
jgi:glutamate synthase domain-containing protein 1